jgi:predicted enzyme related to lactoylglutathione lyase
VAGAFLWFSLDTEDPATAREFYASLLEWEIGEEGMVAGEDRPWAAINASRGRSDARGWVPYVQVEDVDRATERARQLGATVLQEKTRGPAGDFATIADPAGAAVALWEPSQ